MISGIGNNNGIHMEQKSISWIVRRRDGLPHNVKNRLSSKSNIHSYSSERTACRVLTVCMLQNGASLCLSAKHLVRIEKNIFGNTCVGFFLLASKYIAMGTILVFIHSFERRKKTAGISLRITLLARSVVLTCQCTESQLFNIFLLGAYRYSRMMRSNWFTFVNCDPNSLTAFSSNKEKKLWFQLELIDHWRAIVCNSIANRYCFVFYIYFMQIVHWKAETSAIATRNLSPFILRDIERPNPHRIEKEYSIRHIFIVLFSFFFF